jgi:isoamylase
VFTIGAAPLSRRWYRSIDTSLPSPEDIVAPGDEVVVAPQDEYAVGPRSMVVLISRTD